MGAAVDLSGVTVAFRLADGGTYTAVSGATLSVADGEFVAIVGPTGCGKSTLLNVAAGLQAPASGTVRKLGALLSRAGLGPRRLRVVVEPGGTHSEGAWARRLPSALEFLYEV